MRPSMKKWGVSVVCTTSFGIKTPPTEKGRGFAKPLMASISVDAPPPPPPPWLKPNRSADCLYHRCLLRVPMVVSNRPRKKVDVVGMRKKVETGEIGCKLKHGGVKIKLASSSPVLS